MTHSKAPRVQPEIIIQNGAQIVHDSQPNKQKKGCFSLGFTGCPPEIKIRLRRM